MQKKKSVYTYVLYGIYGIYPTYFSSETIFGPQGKVKKDDMSRICIAYGRNAKVTTILVGKLEGKMTF